jgi:hypothetical protein
MDITYSLREMDKEEGAKLTAELQAVLAKYDAEMGVSSNIELLKRVATPTNTTEEPIVSPLQQDDLGNDNTSGSQTSDSTPA